MSIVSAFNDYRAKTNEKILAIANLVGGSICIPHTRRAVEYWSALETESVTDI